MNAPVALPANISIANARLPATYEAAKTALANCADLDECVDWSNKADALASYAKQAEDESLHQFATRIRARAIRRAGELLKQVDGQGRRSDTLTEGAHGKLTQRDAARAAGLSEHRQLQSVRVANVPAEKFDDWIDSDDPPTITKLAEAGKQARPVPTAHLQGREPEQFAAATHTLGAMRRFAEKCGEHNAVYVAAGVLPSEVSEARSLVASIDAWLDRFVVNLKG